MMSNQQNESHPDHAPDLRVHVIGTFIWQVEQLARGESLFKEATGESTRRICLRAIDTVIQRNPERAFDVSLRYVIHPDGIGTNVRVYRIERVK